MTRLKDFLTTRKQTEVKRRNLIVVKQQIKFCRMTDYRRNFSSEVYVKIGQHSVVWALSLDKRKGVRIKYAKFLQHLS